MVYCKICGKESEKTTCKRCQYFLDHGAGEEEIKQMLSDDKTMKIWKQNEDYAKELAEAYYESLIETYPADDSKENFGFNTFTDGIKLGLDVVMPLLDEKDRVKAVEKIKSMLKRSEERDEG